MKHPIRKVLVLLLLILFVLPVIAYWAVDSWLESSGGKRMLERELSARTGMDVRLQGDFNLMLYPDLGVSGTELAVHDADSSALVADSAEYEISLALQPLLDGRFHVGWIRLTGGGFFPERLRNEPGADADEAASTPIDLQVDELAIRDFDWVLSAEQGRRIHVERFIISDFAAERPAPFALSITGLGDAEGQLRLDTTSSRLDLHALDIRRLEQRLSGSACVFLGDPFSVHLVLEADGIDLDRLREGIPDDIMGSGSGTGATSPGEPDEPAVSPLPDIRIQLSADELRAGDVTARGVVLNIGKDPQCEAAGGLSGETG